MTEGGEGLTKIESSRSPLPDIRRFRSAFGYLELDKWSGDGRDTIFNWWREAGGRADYFQRFAVAAEAKAVPSLEKKEAKSELQETKAGFDAINTSINLFIERPKSTIKDSIRRAIQGIYRTPPEVEEANKIVEAIDTYIENHDQENEQIVAVLEAISETQDLDQDIETVRQKIAQHGFEEMMTLFPYQRFAYLHEAGEEPTTVDHLQSEKLELISAIKGDVWTGKERRKYRAMYNRFRKMMDVYEFETEVKTGFNFVFELAIGEASLSRNSAISILKRVEDVWVGIKNDSTLQEAWEYELEKEEEDEEGYEEDEE